MKSIKVAAIQPKITQNNTQNLDTIQELVSQAMRAAPDIICLPERWYHLDFNQPASEIFQEKRSIQYNLIKSLAESNHVGIISGGIWERDPQTHKSAIRCYYFDKYGREQFSQKKIHLYGIERELHEPGRELVCFTDPELNVTFCILICFDLHISSMLATRAAEEGAEVIFSPTLIRDDGMENWAIYLKARALEHRIPIVSCNSVYKFYEKTFSGRSKILQFEPGPASPVKLSVKELETSQDILISNINLEYANSIRGARLVQKRGEDEIAIRKVPVNHK